MSERIKGGYILKARCIEKSAIAHAPPHAREVFDYFLRTAFWKDGEKLKRGQLHTCYRDIQNDLCWYIGNRPMRYEKHHIETAVKLLKKAGAITAVKATRGMLVTVCNYERFQTPENYENHTETDLKPTRDLQESPTIDEEGKKLRRENISTPAPKGFPHEDFERFRKAHPDCERVKDSQFQVALAAYPGADVSEAVEAFERQLAGAKQIYAPVREFEKYLRRSVGGKEYGGRFQKKTRGGVNRFGLSDTDLLS